jgi:hypothetical protein
MCDLSIPNRGKSSSAYGDNDNANANGTVLLGHGTQQTEQQRND